MHAFSQVNRTGIARSTEPVGTQSQSQNSPPLRMQVRTTIRSKNQTTIHPKALQNRAQIGRKSLPRTSQEPSGARVSPKSARKRSKRGRLDALGGPQGRPKSDQGRPKSTQRGPKCSPEGPRERQNRPQVGLRSENSQICEKCSATRPCRRSRHSAPLQIDPESAQNGPKSVPRTPRAVPSVDFGPSKAPRAASASDSGRLGRPSRPGIAAQQSISEH